MTGDLRTLRTLRDDVRRLERELDDARTRRDGLAAWLRARNFPARDVGSAGGIAPSYVEHLADRARKGLQR